jgi:hypothetical protein
VNADLIWHQGKIGQQARLIEGLKLVREEQRSQVLTRELGNVPVSTNLLLG